MIFTKLAETAKVRLLEDDNQFHEKSERLVGLMRALGIVPTRRAKCNGHLHKLLGAILVCAYDEDTSVDVTNRRKGDYHTLGLSTNMIKWLDNLVANKLLIPSNGAAKASGRLELATPLTEEIA
tara:strand:- start:459 stop:830 length:372 start_codon:yes stop_codon:yes gene_type:complete